MKVKFKGWDTNLVSAAYRHDLNIMHTFDERWGADGAKHLLTVQHLVTAWGCNTVLDYGCGKGRLKTALERHTDRPLTITEYDPGIIEKSAMPQGAHLVVCTDVLEHVEPDKLSEVLLHLHGLTRIVAYFVIATRPAKKQLPSGANAHLIIKDETWWLERLKFVGFVPREIDVRDGKEIRVICTCVEPHSSSGNSQKV